MMKPGLYCHFKGGMYIVLQTTRFNTAGEAKTLLDGKEVVVYMSLKDGSYHTRPLEEFSDYVLHPDGNRSVLRFLYVGDL